MPAAAVAVRVALYSVRCGAVGRPSVRVETEVVVPAVSVAVGVPEASIALYSVRCGAVGRPSVRVESEVVVPAVSVAVGVPEASTRRRYPDSR